jgi:hypothetical protein
MTAFAKSWRREPIRNPQSDAGEPAALLRAGGLRLVEHLVHDRVYRDACKLGFEGIVSKRVGSPYRSGRSRDWLKTHPQ